ncbi:hypothetical protein [Sandaracinus amylolyticus]|uniref:Uncharacterized protein n=1 Tax=Sandaracinus amylolyticus TaxID=927083 RepID=A0A0F6W6B5_9BACT|nr:hypothetical protein [Sandaracinus amylolyticus]AKF08421.1 hypothetical protein DB32_005570 [Sandaracinus amylolyticus]
MTTTSLDRADHPPSPPKLRPRLHLPRAQWLGLLLFTLPPALALGGLFDAHEEHVTRRVGPLEVHAEIPQRVRQNRYAMVQIDLVNRGDRATRAEVAISPEYVREAIAVEMTPAPRRAWASDVGPIEPGERARVVLELQADGAGPHAGVLRVRDESGEETRIELSTFVFP